MGEPVQLPTEIWQMILESLTLQPHLDSTRNALLQLSLTCRTIRPIAQTFLCRDLFCKQPTVESLKTALKLAALHDLLPQQIHFGRYPLRSHAKEIGSDINTKDVQSQNTGLKVLSELMCLCKPSKDTCVSKLSVLTCNNDNFDVDGCLDSGRRERSITDRDVTVMYVNQTGHRPTASQRNSTHINDSLFSALTHLSLQGRFISLSLSYFDELRFICLNSTIVHTDLLQHLDTCCPMLEHLVLVAPSFSEYPYSNFLLMVPTFRPRLTVINPRAKTINDPYFKRIHRDNTYLEDCARDRRVYDLQIYRVSLEHLGGSQAWSDAITKAIQSSSIWDMALSLGQRCGRSTGLSVPY
ncbi:hypothetical protein BCR37DRAFT_231070 [Protomyces lactucae-debilis]|uniref:F-box domain-containing protein n=1 Tax=Protomyces lactucae-debilis TaxID=2754530 RepID=A0A1Y2EQ73_PROLT|nr:uncharacterized protein BCR37DRAFT_231070 [Protomyces lactucae-debilis]ORY73687.1 hypothetical protein BCR37DRAFT_231070 [Protomyces lactucae-debilis]